MSTGAVIAAGVVGVIFILHGVIFVVQPPRALDQMKDKLLTLGQFRLLGLAEIAGGAVFVSEVFVNVPKLLLGAAAIGIIGVLIPATVLHWKAHELPQVGFTVVLTLLSLYVLLSAAGV
jgi:hypothetical protein